MKQNLTELKGEIENLIVTVEDFSSFLGIDKLADRYHQGYRMPDNTIHQPELIGIYSILCSKTTTKYTFFSNTHGTLPI